MPESDGTVRFWVGNTTGCLSSTCQSGLFSLTTRKNDARCMASPNCVNPACDANGVKIGEATVLTTWVVPSRVTPFENVRLIGIISTGIEVVADPADGLVPTIV